MTNAVGRLAALIVGAAILATVVAACSQELTHGDPATLRSYAQRYVALLNDQDEAGLQKHLASPAEWNDAADRIAAYGGQDWQVSDVRWAEHTEMADIYRVEIDVSGSRGEHTWQLEIRWDSKNGRDLWMTVPLEERDPARPPADTQQPSS